MVHAGSEEVIKPRFESRPGVEYKLREHGNQSKGLSWLQASEGRSTFLQSKGSRDTVTVRCWNLAHVGQLLVDEPGTFAIPSPVCPVIHEL